MDHSHAAACAGHDPAGQDFRPAPAEIRNTVFPVAPAVPAPPDATVPAATRPTAPPATALPMATDSPADAKFADFRAWTNEAVKPGGNRATSWRAGFHLPRSGARRSPTHCRRSGAGAGGSGPSGWYASNFPPRLQPLEVRVNTRGDFTVLATLPPEGSAARFPAIIRTTRYRRRDRFRRVRLWHAFPPTTASSLPVNGIALDGKLAVAESAARLVAAGRKFRRPLRWWRFVPSPAQPFRRRGRTRFRRTPTRSKSAAHFIFLWRGTPRTKFSRACRTANLSFLAIARRRRRARLPTARTTRAPEDPFDPLQFYRCPGRARQRGGRAESLGCHGRIHERELVWDLARGSRELTRHAGPDHDAEDQGAICGRE